MLTYEELKAKKDEEREREYAHYYSQICNHVEKVKSKYQVEYNKLINHLENYIDIHFDAIFLKGLEVKFVYDIFPRNSNISASDVWLLMVSIEHHFKTLGYDISIQVSNEEYSKKVKTGKFLWFDLYTSITEKHQRFTIKHSDRIILLYYYMEQPKGDLC